MQGWGCERVGMCRGRGVRGWVCAGEWICAGGWVCAGGWGCAGGGVDRRVTVCRMVVCAGGWGWAGGGCGDGGFFFPHYIYVYMPASLCMHH